MTEKIAVGLVCGGPSLERGISLNSARTLLDHLGASDDIEIVPFYVDVKERFYRITCAQLYSNTPSDFDFKLTKKDLLPWEKCVEHMRDLDIVFPVIHGAFGEDGTLQRLLNEAGIPFVGADASCCRQMVDKKSMRMFLKKKKLGHLESLQVLYQGESGLAWMVQKFWDESVQNAAVVKPNRGGSSIGVSMVTSVDEAMRCVSDLHDRGEKEVILEPFVHGREFTVIVLQDHETGSPVALLPTEISLLTEERFPMFSYRRKYLPTANTLWTCPSFEENHMLESIQKEAECLFESLGCRDFVRFDGWVVDGRIVWSDFNPISGFEQNSFIFLQGVRTGMTHQHVLRYILNNALQRVDKALPLGVEYDPEVSGRSVRVLFGGDTAERQVSLMSGLNVWLQLMHTRNYVVTPYLLSGNDVWQIPYAFALFHTVEEILEQCQSALAVRKSVLSLRADLRDRLHLAPMEDFEMPTRTSLTEFIAQAKSDNAYVFLGLHGGIGEDGSIQALLTQSGCQYNGSLSEPSALFMDKKRTGEYINSLHMSHISALPKILLSAKEGVSSFDNLWKRLVSDLGSKKIIIKPNFDGCSAGVVLLTRAHDLKIYFSLLGQEAVEIPPHTFEAQESVIVLPHAEELICEPFIECDEICIRNQELTLKKKTGWVELTVGVVRASGQQRHHAFHPSMTIADGSVLSLEEKFQGGTGINITPPPVLVMSEDDIIVMRKRLSDLASKLGVGDYARIDLFYHRERKEMCIIEVNALPGLTPSTVLYHQSLADETPLTPREFLAFMLKRSAQS
ncbi:MAG: hypothetical protein OXC30_03725 [Alphaproteobacteria bacterium]|nr:hypothetical protein [Alphaproteobacteria bacterium]